MKNLPFFHAHFRASASGQSVCNEDTVPSLRSSLTVLFCKHPAPLFKPAFSLVEMLMALLVASLLLAALAPVMTRKLGDRITIDGQYDPKSTTTKKEILYGSDECPIGTTPNIADDGSEYCEGTYTVPANYTGVIRVTVIGAGGGGGTAPTAGLKEYTVAGSTNNFTVPAMVNQIEATLISGGAGGGAGGQIETNVDYNIAGDYTWTIPAIAWDKNAIIIACGGGGGAGGSTGYGGCYQSSLASGNGGRGGYTKAAVALNSSNVDINGSTRTQKIIIGGGGGGGAAGATSALASGLSGRNGGGGGGGADAWCGGCGYGGLGGKQGGDGGGYKCGCVAGLGGKKGDSSLSTNTDGQDGTGTATLGGSGGGAGEGGATRSGNSTTGPNGGGGGGGSTTGYGGGGGSGGNGYGGGGGGGGATIFGTRNNQIVMAPGGGGGGASGVDDYNYNTRKRTCDYSDTTRRFEVLKDVADSYVTACARWLTSGGGGGGGGGTGGGAGGIGGRGWFGDPAPGGNGANNPTSVIAIFGADRCNGGTGDIAGMLRSPKMGGSGQDGAMRITYLDYGTGGGGGGSGQVVAIQPLSVNDGETLKISLGSQGTYGKHGEINSAGTIVLPTLGGGGNTGDEITSKIFRDTTLILTTASVYNEWGTCGGHSSGQVYEVLPGYGIRGFVSDGKPGNQSRIQVNGFSTENGKTANNGTTLGNITYPNGSTGGDGGRVTTPWFACTPGKGGTASNPIGGNASGYGCGGGGGYGLSDGGSGSGGYARISWNKYWDVALNSGKGAYRLSDTGTGGGGASGNIMTYSVKVMGGQNIRIRIGKGGDGATIINNTMVNAQKGGDTVFGDDAIGEIKAGGGFGGGNPSVVNKALVNGVGGNASSVCHYGSKSFLKNKAYCTQGEQGFNAQANTDTNKTAQGASGRSLPNYGTGGKGGISGTNAYKGDDATGIGSGGGGAAVHDLGNDSVDPLSGTNQGGKGSNGKIIIELYDL